MNFCNHLNKEFEKLLDARTAHDDVCVLHDLHLDAVDMAKGFFHAVDTWDDIFSRLLYPETPIINIGVRGTLSMRATEDWSFLPGSVIVLIARHVQVMDDFIAFRGTCTIWRAATTLKDFHKWRYGLPLLRLNKTKFHEKPRKRKRNCMKDRYCELFSLYKKNIIQIPLPEAKGKRCIASKGWFFMIGSSRDMSLLNPITRVQIHLPSIPDDHELDYWVQRAVLSASPSETSEYVVVVIYRARDTSYMGFWKSGGLAWKKTQEPLDSRFKDVSYHNGKIYTISEWSEIWMFDVGETGEIINATKLMELPEIPNYQSVDYVEAFFMECGGKLFVLRCRLMYVYGGTSLLGGFKMTELDVIKCTYTNISSLGDKTVFMGKNEVFCVDAMRYPGIIEPNCIYFSDGSYRFESFDGSVDKHTRRWGVSHNIKHEGIPIVNYNAWVMPTF